ncbi:AmpG family muropeptide MFS transporter [Alishewanella jeotgali]|uniref:AmpG protein n=1 Tax=Alishewanella jeotgali KCTC 22429 TaxID=1129374 RepID=H3ZGX3_9ALTE|nr:MFS transporter [Alishewanella jeotgali]EHR40113.1 AmpG protein [Alishewanella jeotgali KCTC 22429]
MLSKQQGAAQSWRQALASYQDIRLLFIFFMGCASGFPWVLIGSNMSGWLNDAGLSRAAIGYFGSIFVVYALNFLWAPLLDRIKLPLLSRYLGQRRSWILLMQSLMLLATLAIAYTNPGESLLFTSLLAMTIALASATQDVAIDAYRIELIGDDTIRVAPAAAMGVIGWWTGYSLPGYLAFSHADQYGWPAVYLGMAALIALLMIFTLLSREPNTEREQLQQAAAARYQASLGRTAGKPYLVWLSVTVFEPFVEFFRRNGWQLAILILSFVFLFKIGEAFLGRMSIQFYKEVGFSNEQIAEYSKLVGWVATIGFTLIGSAINIRFGIIRGLFIGGVAMAASNLMFAWIALAGPKPELFIAAILVDNFTAAFSTVAFVSFLTWLTGRAFTATQYALLASLGNLGRTTLASFSGELVDALAGNWALFFVITALMVIPGLCLLLIVGKKLQQREQQRTST